MLMGNSSMPQQGLTTGVAWPPCCQQEIAVATYQQVLQFAPQLEALEALEAQEAQLLQSMHERSEPGL